MEDYEITKPFDSSAEKSPTNGCPMPSIVSFFSLMSSFLKFQVDNSKHNNRKSDITQTLQTSPYSMRTLISDMNRSIGFEN